MPNNPQRLVSMDVLRGFALLGILLMNIQSFAMPGAAYLNPTAYGDLTGLNFAVWSVSHVLADQKFMSLFSLLFGAGVALFCQNAQNKGHNAGRLHAIRMLWLLVFGLLHGYLLWYGDILYAYALCGFIIYWLRNMAVKGLLITAFSLLLISSAYSILQGIGLQYFPADAKSQILSVWAPSSAELLQEIKAYQGDYASVFTFRAEETFFMQTYVFLTMLVWRATAMMLIGMALFKSGFFHLRWAARQYRRLCWWGLLPGLAFVSYGMYTNLEHNFSLAYSMFLGSQFNYWGSILMALGYTAGVMLMVKGALFSGLQRRLAAIGKTAFSHYILHTLVFTCVFYGYGAGLFGELQRWQLMCLVVLMWLCQLWLAPVWLKHFAYGPLEWLWRSLTYTKWQPIRRVAATPG